MKRFYLFLFLGLAALARAQNPENEIPTFDLDDFYVEPKFSMSVGTRLLDGSKVAFGGQGVIAPLAALKDVTDLDVVREYHDGLVLRDAREGATDLKTNTWTYVDGDQVIDAGANIAFHQYSAQVTDATVRRNDPGMSLGTELVLSRDMGKIGQKIEWKLFAGVGINGISSNAQGNVQATINTITDVYSLGRQTLPSDVPYVAPSSTADADGNVTDTTVLLGQRPDSRASSSVSNNTQVSNFWKLKGTYVTFRMGPSLTYKIRDNLWLNFSAGPTLVYSGTDYSVEQTLVPDTADPIVSKVTESELKALTGYYVDATVEYRITERAGLYAGAFYQSSGDYTSTITQNGSSYTTDIDLSQLQGFRAGLNFKF
ncbi:MAG: hypothetical protein IT582_11855 [Opitutaceae bacterium]|nr:hypothetical protein [Opitutaceae bacterium]